ncbi:hypothetical protein PM082_007059 [Marasmius tenuissimus]|nr:hypothetical protein PM082_007059 [Marasmius tenuissimus]
MDYVVDDLHRRTVAEEEGIKDRIHSEQDIRHKEDNTSSGHTVEETGVQLDETDYEVIEPGAENPMEEGSALRTTGNHSTTTQSTAFSDQNCCPVPDLSHLRHSSTQLQARSNFLEAATQLTPTLSRWGRSLMKL